MNELTENQRHNAYHLWWKLTGCLDSGVVPEDRIQTIIQEIQNFFKRIGNEKGIKITERCLVKHDKALVQDFDSVRAYLHTFWEKKDPMLRRTLELGIRSSTPKVNENE